MGTGNFYGIMPEETRNNSTLDGVEIDTLTARIAHYLYPRANIQNKGFERAKLEKPYDIVSLTFSFPSKLHIYNLLPSCIQL